jgi:hypothetical protein
MRNATQLFEVPSRARPSQHPGPPEILRTHRTQVDFEVEIDVVSALRRQPTYDRSAAYLLAAASAWAYADPEALTMVLAKCGMRDPTVTLTQIRNPAMLVDVDAYVISGANVGILCFRGTEFGTCHVIDVLTDVDAVLTRSFMNDGHVHRGFHQSVLFVWDFIRRAIDQNFRDEQGQLTIDSFYIAGHSLGGALAVLAADRIFKSGRYADLEQALMGVYTYGQPAVGDKEFKLSCTKAGLAERVFRHVYARDWVPTLPPVSTGMYHHFGNLYVSTPRGWLPSSEKPGRALTLLGSGVIAAGAFLGRRFRPSRWLMDRLGVTFSLEDHLPVYYVETSRISQLPPFP